MISKIHFEGLDKITYFGNTLEGYLNTVIVFVVILIVLKIVQWLILNRLKYLAKKTKTDVDDTLIDITESIKPPVYFLIAIWLALHALNVQEFVQKVFDSLLIIILVYQVVISIQILINYIVSKGVQDKSSRSISRLVSNIAKGVLWTLAVLLILQNLGVNVTSLIAGLGIGGVAVALALQNILGDLFNSFAIHFDKPFQIDDFIVVGSDMGVVKKIGIKSTRLESLQGEETVISNTELTSARIHNYKKMLKRRVVVSFGVTYDTKLEKLKAIPGIVEHIIKDAELTEFDRAHFMQFGDSALMFEVVYYVLSGEYNQYMDINQQIHLGIKEKFEQEQISMAFPTRTVYLEK